MWMTLRSRECCWRFVLTKLQSLMIRPCPTRMSLIWSSRLSALWCRNQRASPNSQNGALCDYISTAPRHQLRLLRRSRSTEHWDDGKNKISIIRGVTSDGQQIATPRFLLHIFRLILGHVCSGYGFLIAEVIGNTIRHVVVPVIWRIRGWGTSRRRDADDGLINR